MLNTLNDRFAIDDRLVFRRHSSGLTQAIINSPLCRGSFFLLGAHVAEFQPVDNHPILFMSEKSNFAEGMPIRGGIPVCFPWFGLHPSDANAPAHGLVRTAVWEVLATEAEADGILLAILTIQVEQWRLVYHIRFGKALDLSLEIYNQANDQRDCEIALHTYFNITDIHATTIHGVESLSYLDKLTQQTVAPSGEPLGFSQETDRIYFGQAASIVIDDAARPARIKIRPRNSKASVVWNPWIDKSERMADFGDHEYLRMCCVETANVASQRVKLGSGELSNMGVSISVE